MPEEGDGILGKREIKSRAKASNLYSARVDFFKKLYGDDIEAESVMFRPVISKANLKSDKQIDFEEQFSDNNSEDNIFGDSEEDVQHALDLDSKTLKKKLKENEKKVSKSKKKEESSEDDDEIDDDLKES